MQTYRSGYPFWRHVFTVPDGRLAFGRPTRAVGIPAAATVPAGYIPAPRYTGTIA